MESTDYGIQDPPGPPRHPHRHHIPTTTIPTTIPPTSTTTARGQLFAQQTSGFPPHHHHQQQQQQHHYDHFSEVAPPSSFNSAWNVNSPYALSAIQQEPFNSHDPHSTYSSYVPHQQTFAAAATPPPPVSQARSPAQFDPAFDSGFHHSFNHSLDPRVFNATIAHPLGPRVYQQNSDYATGTSFADHDLEMATLPDFGGPSTTPGATVAPYALLNVSTQQRTDDRAQTNQEYADQWNAPASVGTNSQLGQSNSSSSSNPLSTSQSSGTSTAAGRNVQPTPTNIITIVNVPNIRLDGDRQYWQRTRPDRPKRNINATLDEPGEKTRCSIRDLRRLFPGYQGPARKIRTSIRARESYSRRVSLKGTRKRLKDESESEAEHSSDYENDRDDGGGGDDDEYEYEDHEICPLPSEKPTDRIGAIRYDTIKALWRPRYQSLPKEQSKEALSDFSQIATTFRDEWGAVGKDETEKKGTPESIKARYAEQREILESSLLAALEHGHEFIVEKIGEHRLFMSYLCRVLQERIKNDDYTSSSVSTILEFLSRVALTKDLLEQLKFSKLKSRLEKKGNDKTRELLKKIDENVALASKDESKPSTKEEEPANGTTSKPSLPEETRPTPIQVSVTGSKRPSENDNGQVQPLKKQATAATAVPGSGPSKMTKSPGLFDRRSKPSMSLPQSTATGAASASNSKPRTPPLPASSTGMFAGLKPASKVKPGSTAPRMIFTQSGPPEKPATKAPNTGPPRPVFSIIGTLDSLNKAEVEEAKTEEAKKLANETEEEKKKRLRKEERRKLRVTFKPDDSLEEVRYFTHAQEEDVGREDNLLRDAADAVEEGRMFKQHKELDVMDVDEDEDNAIFDGVLLRPFLEPPSIEFEDIDPLERGRNMVTRGGVVEVDSPEIKVRDEEDANRLIVFYSRPGDIPPNPRELLSSDDVEFNPEVIFGTPPSQVTDRDPTVIAARNQMRGQADQRGQADKAVPTIDVSAILSGIAEIRAKEGSHSQVSTTDLERTFASHSIMALRPQTVQQSQPNMLNPAQILDVQRIAATLASTTQPSYNQPQNSLSAQDPKLQNVLAQIAQLNPAFGREPAHQSRGQQDSSWGGGDNDRRDWGRGQRDNHHGGGDDEWRGRSRGYHSGGDYDRRSDYKNGNSRDYGRMRNEGDDRKGSFDGRKNYQHNNSQKKSTPCSYYAKGHCRNGDYCQFQHGPS